MADEDWLQSIIKESADIANHNVPSVSNDVSKNMTTEGNGNQGTTINHIHGEVVNIERSLETIKELLRRLK